MKFVKLCIILLATASSIQMSAQLSSRNSSFIDLTQSSTQDLSLDNSTVVSSTATLNDISEQLAFKINYPVSMIPYEIEGKSTVKLTINKNGSVEDVEILESLGTAFDIEIMNTVNKLGAISPILYDGVPKKQTIVFPIQFRL